MMQKTHHISTRIIEYKVFVNNMDIKSDINSVCEPMTQQQQCIYSHDFNNQHQHISIHASIIKSTPITRKKIHQQHICTYTYIIHQHHRHNNPTTIIMIINNITIV